MASKPSLVEGDVSTVLRQIAIPLEYAIRKGRLTITVD